MSRQFAVHNTLTRTTERLVTRNEGEVSLYTCGPTVYGPAHIGNYRTYIFEDVLVRVLRYFGYTVTWVMNITDVGHLTSDEDEGDDKLEVGARREGLSAWDVAKKYEVDFLQNLDALHIVRPDRLVRATDAISEQIELIKRLEAGGHTYVTEDGVYFDSMTFPDYGKMARLDLEGQQAGARVAVQEGKRHPSDFALWKFSPSDRKRDMEWESPWGTGFPGWHLECSAIAMKELGEEIDIHTGGVDHIPVHHTNEIAQSESATGKQFVRYWMHGEFLLIDGGKMSKSLANDYTLKDLREKGFDPLDFRYFTYTASYRAKLNFTWDAMAAAKAGLERLRAQVRSLGETAEEPGETGRVHLNAIESALADDLGVPRVLAHLWELLRSDLPSGQKLHVVRQLEPVLALDLFREPEKTIVPDDVQALVHEREQVRAAKDWAASDRLREQIEALGFTVSDTAGGTVVEKMQ